MSIEDAALSTSRHLEGPKIVGLSCLIDVVKLEAGQMLRCARIVVVVATVLLVEGTVRAQADACAGAIPVSTGVYTGSTAGMTSDGSSACQSTSPDVWFKYVADAQPKLVEITTCGSSFDTVLSTHTGCPGINQNVLDCNDDWDACGSASRLRFMPNPGQTIYIRLCGYQQDAGDYAFNVQELTGPADVYVGNMSESLQGSRSGDLVSVLTDSPICNAGESPIDWYGAPIGIAPMFVFNMYRLKDGRLEQIGASWAKHSQGTSQEDWCGFGCAALPTIQRLGPGCSDTYNSNINGRQLTYAPRSEVNAWNGAFTYATSMLANPVNPSTETERLCEVRDQDLDPALNSGATYFLECYAVAHDDSNHMNSLSHRKVAITGGSPGATWSFELQGPAINGPIMQSYTGATAVQIPALPIDDGRCFVACKTSEVSAGVYRFEYAVYNHDKHRGIRQFSVPVGSSTTIANVGFSAPPRSGDPGTSDAWEHGRSGAMLVWEAPAYEPTLSSNPIGWGMTYNFWFEATLPEGVKADRVRVGMYLPGVDDEQRGWLSTPAQICAADLDDGSGAGIPDDAVEINDLLYFLTAFEAGSTTVDLDDGAGLGNSDGAVTIDDLLFFLVRFENGC